MPTPYLPVSHGVLLISGAVAAWTDYTAGDFVQVGPRAPVAGNFFGELVVVNTDGSQPLYLLLRANAAEATDDAIYVGAGSSRVLALHGKSVTGISVQGTAVGTDARLDADFVEMR